MLGMMVKLKFGILAITLSVFVFCVFLTFVNKDNLSSTQFFRSVYVKEPTVDTPAYRTEPPSNIVVNELTKIRDTLSRLLNQKQHELAKLQCEVNNLYTCIVLYFVCCIHCVS